MKKYTAVKISQFLDVSVATINNWYRWYNNPKFEKPADTPYLPAPSLEGRYRYWTDDDLYYLRKFKEWLPRGRGGVMGDSNAYFWGERGKRALRNKELKRQKKKESEL